MNQRHSHILRLSLALLALILAALACRQTSEMPEAVVPASTGSAPTTTRPSPQATETSGPEALHQWAVAGMDRWDTGAWVYAIGAPDADPGCILNRWESWVYHADPHVAHDFLQLFYGRPVIPTLVNIHLAYDHSAITRVALIDVDGNAHEIYAGEPGDLADCPSIFTIELEGFNQPVYAVRVDVATLWDNAGITAIDAVELVGQLAGAFVATPEPTPYVTVSSLGRSINDLPEGFAHITILDNNANKILLEAETDAFSWNLTEEERTIRFFTGEGGGEAWLYLPADLLVGDFPLNSYNLTPTGRLFYDGRYIPAMEGYGAIDWLSETHASGVVEFWGFDPDNNIDYYKVVLVFNQIPLDERASWKPGDLVLQWADTAVASSQQGEVFFSAAQAAGPSDTWADCELAPSAWLPQEDHGQHWIELTFEVPVYPETLTLLMTANPGSVVGVDLLFETDFWPLDLAAARLLPGCPAAWVFEGLGDVDLAVSGVLVTLEVALGEDKPGIDAVQLIGVMAD